MEIKVELNHGIFGNYGACIQLDDVLYQEEFCALSLSDNTIPFCTSFDSAQCKRIVKLRKNSAKIISEKLTSFLIKAMAKNDTYEGYPFGKLSDEEQEKIMVGQLSAFHSLTEKMKYMHEVFDSDPNFSKKARDNVRGIISQQIKQGLL